MGGSIVRKFQHREKFGPFRRLALDKDVKECFKFLVDMLRFAISLRVADPREGDVIFQKLCKFSSKDRSKLWASVRDDSIIEAKSGEGVLEKDLDDVHSGGGFVARAEIYPLHKTMVYHNQNTIITMEQG